jgi:ribosomal protein L29
LCERELVVAAGILLVGFLQLFVADSAAPLQPLDRSALEKMSDEERQAYLKALDEQLLRLQEQRDKALKERQASLDAVRKQRAAAEPTATEAIYQIDPLLKKAYLMFQDFEHRNRDQTIAAFEEYIRRNPDSVFLPEVYHCMGVMYCGNDNAKNGETMNLGKMREYYLKSFQGFGGKFSVGAMVAYNHLAFIGGTFEEQLKYYDWLRYMQEKGTKEDLYNIMPIASCISGFAPQRSSKNLEGMLNNIKTVVLPLEIPATEKQLFRDAFQRGRDTYMELSILARLYPDTELGRQARHAVDQAEEKMGLHSAVFDLNTPEVREENSASEPNQPQETPKAVAESREIPVMPQALASRQQGSRSWPFLLGAAGVVLAAGTILLVRSRKGRMDRTLISQEIARPDKTETISGNRHAKG